MCCKENIVISTEELDRLIQSTNQDIRQVINHLAMLSGGSDGKEKAAGKQMNKDLRLGPWDVINKVFSSNEHRNMSIHDKSDLFFHDYNIAALFVQENYLSVTPKAPKYVLTNNRPPLCWFKTLEMFQNLCCLKKTLCFDHCKTRLRMTR